MPTPDVLDDTFKHLFANAFESHKSGQLKDAKDLYEQILTDFPNHDDSLHLLGLVFHQSGHSDVAEGLIHKAVGLRPKNPLYLCNYASVLNVLEKYEAAQSAAKTAIKFNAKDPDAFHNLGIAQLSLNNYRDAEQSLCKAVELSPDNPEFLNNFGAALNKLYKFDLARDAFEKAVKADPSHAVSHANLAGTLNHMGRNHEAFNSCQQALNINNKYQPAYHTLGQIELLRGNNQAAIGALETSISLAPKNANSFVALASAYSNSGQIDKARELLERARELDPNSASACHRLALWYSESGDLDQSISLLQEALKLDPTFALAYYELAESKQHHFDAATVTHLESLLQKMTIDPKDKVRLNFALAIEHDQCKEFRLAADHYLAANEMQKTLRETAGYGHIATEFDRQIETISQFFTKTFFTQHSYGGANPSSQPVFIVGLPRSGTTLVDRIISSHPQATSVGEITKIPNISDILYSEGYKDIGPVTIERAAEDYLSHIRDLAGDVDRVVDKLPFNFLHLGVIQQLFPNAKIIHCSRDDVDVGLSNFLQNFADNLTWSNDLTDIGRYIKAYRNLMIHWDKALPSPALTIAYEDVVDDTEEQAKRIIEFLDLPWDDSCLEFHRSEGQVQTASRWQVRTPVYSSSVGKWRNYEKMLAPLMSELEK